VKQMFYEVIKLRKESGTREEDMLQTLIDTPYKSDAALFLNEIFHFYCCYMLLYL